MTTITLCGLPRWHNRLNHRILWTVTAPNVTLKFGNIHATVIYIFIRKTAIRLELTMNLHGRYFTVFFQSHRFQSFFITATRVCKNQTAETPNLDDFVKKLEDHGDICVLLSDRDKVEIVVLDETKRDASMLYNRRHVTLLFAFHHQRHKLVDYSHVQITAIIARYQHFPFQIQNVHHRRRHVGDYGQN